MCEAQSSPPARRGARVIGTDALRIFLISQEPSDGEERNPPAAGSYTDTRKENGRFQAQKNAVACACSTSPIDTR